jgi:hypothetical protein
MIVPQEKGNVMWRFSRWPFCEIYACFLLFVLRRTNPDGERLLRFLLAKTKVLRRRLKALERALEK